MEENKMNKRTCFIVFAVCVSFLVFGTAAFAFECVAPEGQNCLACHEVSDIHGFHFSELGLTDNPTDCLLCHCGDPGTSNCDDVPSHGPVEAACCADCHTECAILDNHIPGAGNCATCHIGAPENTGIDDDCDGICNPGISDTSCAGSDNCSATPNGPALGTCTSGVIGRTCVSDDLCGQNGFCSMSQEDNVPPGGNDLGDACECEGDFDCDGDQDGSDAASFKIHFGRSTFSRPCTPDDPCYGDFDEDGDVDGTDAAKFKEDFGRSGFSNPCPACTRPVGVLFSVHGGVSTSETNQYLWDAGMQQFSYDPNHSVYKIVIWNPNNWKLGTQEESSVKFIRKYDFEYPLLVDQRDPFTDLTIVQMEDMQAELDSNAYGINFVSDWVGWMCGDCADHLPYPRFMYYGPDGPDEGFNCTYCGEDEADKVILEFYNGTTEFTVGATLTGQTSGATAVITGVTVDSGDWDGTAVGHLSLTDNSAFTGIKFQDNEVITDDGTPGSATANGATKWPNCDPERYNVDGSVERLLKQGVHRIIVVDLTVGGVRFSKTYETLELAQKMLDDWKTNYGVNVPLLWVNDYSDLMKRSFPTAPAGWTRSLGEPDVDSEVLLNGSPNPVAADPDLATLQKEGIEAGLSGSVSDANTGVIIMNHALHDWNEVFDPKMDDTLVLNEIIKAQLLLDHPTMDPDNIIGARMGIKVDNLATEDTRVERTREMRGESLGWMFLYETDKVFPSGGSDPFGIYHPWGYLYWDALDYLINTKGVEHIVIGFPQISTSSVLDMVEFPNQIGKEIGTRNWLKDGVGDPRYPGGGGYPFADYWGIWVDTDCGMWELPFDGGTEPIEMNQNTPNTWLHGASSGASGRINQINLDGGSWTPGDPAHGTFVLTEVVGSFSDGETLTDDRGDPGNALANGTDTQTISNDCCFEMEGCDPDPLPRPYPPPRMTPLSPRRGDMDPSLAYDLSDYGHLGYDPDPLANNQYTGTWEMYLPPDDDIRVGELLAKHVINAIIKPLVYLSNGETESITEGGSVTFTAHVVTGGTSPYTYEWSTNKDDAGWISQGTGSSWTFNTLGGDAGTYAVRCVATDSLSETGAVTWDNFVVSTP
jgi:hypothetical protein